MKARILNRDFQHPADGWYMIEPKGEHPNRRSRVVQVIDDEAAQSIVDRFNADAAAGTLSHGHEMLIDHEHFKHDTDKESRAYGWLQRLQNRADGYYGQVRWTGTGKQSVDEGDYRFFSTEYDPADLKVLNDAKQRKVRPLRLDGLTLTNDPNNKGARPITNRTTRPLAPIPADKCCPDCDCELKPGRGQGVMTCPECQTNFATASAAADSKQQPSVKNTKMKTVCTLLGLSADADEQSVHATVAKLLNRADITPAALTTLQAEHKALGEQNQTLLGEQLDGLLAEHKITDTKVINRLKPILTPLKNRQERLDCLTELGITGTEAKPAAAAAAAGTRILNRGSNAKPEESTAGADDKVVAQKIKNRASELHVNGRSFDSAWKQAEREVLAGK